MPGIFGLIHHSGDYLADIFGRMADAANLFPWQQTDRWVSPTAGLGRTGIGHPIDGQQPVWNRTRDKLAVFAGKLDNADSLRQEFFGAEATEPGDAALALALFDREGLSFASQLNGHFALAIWDHTLRRLVLVTDRYGLVPLYFTRSAGRLAFAFSLHVLCADPNLPRVADERTVADLLTFGYPLGDKTLLEAVSLLPPATVATYTAGDWEQQTYWRLAFPAEADRWDDEHALNELSRLFTNAVERRLVGNPLIPLSAGMDSRAILAAAPIETPLVTYTFGEPDCADQVYARRLADARRTEHHAYTLVPEDIERHAENVVKLTDGTLDLFNAHGVSLADDLRRYGTCVVSGLGGEFIRNFFGYPGHDTEPSGYLFHHIARFFSDIQRRELLTPDLYRRVQGCPEASFHLAFSETEQATVSQERLDSFYLQQRMRRFTLNGVRVFGSRLDYRAPFLDDSVVAGMTQLPVHLKRFTWFHSAFISQHAPDLARIPLGHTNEAISPTFADRLRRKIGRITGLERPPPRRAIVDYGLWARTALASFIERTLLDKRTIGRGYFQHTAIERLIAASKAEAPGAAAQLSMLVTLERGLRLFVDGDR